jgi:hypothetical protein
MMKNTNNKIVTAIAYVINKKNKNTSYEKVPF